MEGDAKGVISAVMSSEQSSCREGHLIEDIKAATLGLHQWKMEFVRRVGNVAAHILAKHAVANCLNRSWVEDFPACIHETIRLEQVASAS